MSTKPPPPPPQLQRWITVPLTRPDGSTVHADLPDNAYHRHFYAERIVRVFTKARA